MKITQIYLSLPKLFDEKKNSRPVDTEKDFPEELKEAILKKHSWRSYYGGKDFSVYTKRYESIYSFFTHDILICLRTPADNMGTHGTTERLYYRIG